MKEKYYVDGSDFLFSLNKLTGKKVKDITGTVSNEFGDPLFQLHSIVFEDDKEMSLGGEHDMPFIEDMDNDELLEQLYKEENPDVE